MPDPIKELLLAATAEEDPLTRFVKNFQQLQQREPSQTAGDCRSWQPHSGPHAG
jgi:hypothetical protein